MCIQMHFLGKITTVIGYWCMYYHGYFLAHCSYDNISHLGWTLEIWSKQIPTKCIRNRGSWEGAEMDMGILCTTYELA